MKVLVVGQGAREHALVWKLKQSPSVKTVYCAPGNAGTALDAINVDIADSDIPKLVEFAKQERIDLTVVGPEVPLVAGLVDLLEAAGLKVFGPSKAAAQLEGSKVYAKKLMKHANVPTADFGVFTQLALAEQWIETQSDRPWVVKANGLAAGKGVIMCSNKAEAFKAMKAMLIHREFGDAGKQILVEECLVGQEASILAICDGQTIVPLEVAQDHKRAYDKDKGPNTGGMGAYCPAPLITTDLMEQIIQEILIPTLHTMNLRETPFKGVLYAGVMVTESGPKTLEYNVRFGDPETQPVLMRLKSDLALVLLAAAERRLDTIEPLEWDPRPTVSVVMASEGYPGAYEKGRVITGLEEVAAMPDVKVFHGGTKLHGGSIVNNGGRVLSVTAIGDDLAEAKQRAYEAAAKIRWQGSWYRRDISDKA